MKSKAPAILKEFETFLMRGNVIDLAVGVVIGGAFGKIVTSLVDDVIMPPIGLLLGGVDFSNLFITLKEGAKVAGPYATLETAKAAGAVTLNAGLFINTLISFTIIGAAIFMLVRTMNKLQSKPEEVVAAPTTKECPYCLSSVPIKATKCAHCTSDLHS